MTPLALHKNIVDFIDRWKNPPAANELGSLEMLSDFALCFGTEWQITVKPANLPGVEK